MTRTSLTKRIISLSVALLISVGAATALAASGGLNSLLLRPGEQTGFSPVGHTMHWTNAGSFVRAGGEKGMQARRDTRTLQAGGFKQAISEHLGGPTGSAGFSLVVEMGSPRAATKLARTLALAASHQGAGRLRALRVPGVPSARGYSFISTRGPSDSNIYWTEGRCTLGSGDLLFTGKPPAKPVITGVKAVFSRTGGTCP